MASSSGTDLYFLPQTISVNISKVPKGIKSASLAPLRHILLAQYHQLYMGGQIDGPMNKSVNGNCCVVAALLKL